MPQAAASPIVSLRHVSKLFAENGVHAARDISLELHTGEIHCVIGENGAGKSTLMHMLAGYLLPDHGTITVAEERLRGGSTREALMHGVVMVHQHPPVAAGMRVWENIVLGQEPTRKKLLNRTRAIRKVMQVVANCGFTLDAMAAVETLSASQVHFAAVVASLMWNPRVLILDEPTAPCTEPEVEVLFNLLRRLTSEGVAIVLITHKLKEVMEIADWVTVMRHGELVSSLPKEETDRASLSAMMLGEDCQVTDVDERLAASVAIGADAVQESSRPQVEEAGPAPTAGNARLVLDEITLRSDGLRVLDRVSLSVHGGEIVGITGIRENGLEYLEDIISGTVAPDDGSLTVDGVEVKHFSPRNFRALGVSYVPTDRLLRGASLDSTVEENLILLRRSQLQRGGVLKQQEIDVFTHALKKRFRITGPLHQPMRRLSGGNIQKVILSRELSDPQKVVIFSEPSWGLDIASTEMVYEEIRALREAGSAVVLISADIDEVLSLSDRIAVMFQGRISTILAENARSREQIGSFMLGIAGADEEEEEEPADG